MPQSANILAIFVLGVFILFKKLRKQYLVPKGFLADTHSFRRHELIDEAYLGDEILARDKECFASSGNAPFDDGRLGIAEHTGSGRYVDEVIANIKVFFEIGP